MYKVYLALRFIFRISLLLVLFYWLLFAASLIVCTFYNAPLTIQDAVPTLAGVGLTTLVLFIGTFVSGNLVSACLYAFFSCCVCFWYVWHYQPLAELCARTLLRFLP